MTDPIAQVGETIKVALEKPREKYPLRRHRDDDYIDRIEIHGEPYRAHANAPASLLLRASIVPRYKTSGLSGDEWRISSVLELWPTGATEPFSRSFHSMWRLQEYAPYFVYTVAAKMLSVPGATLSAFRKGHLLYREQLATFGEAAMGISWLCVTANEGRQGVEWHHVSDADERTHCQQVGCSEPPVNVYHLKQIDEGKHGGHMVTPKYDFEGQYTWYCARHTYRGDCGFEDSDKNLELVEGAGLAREHVADESPSVFGGVTHVTLGEPADR
jgi:hypothetical protein